MPSCLSRPNEGIGETEHSPRLAIAGSAVALQMLKDELLFVDYLPLTIGRSLSRTCPHRAPFRWI
jgi:hypothetical protein